MKISELMDLMGSKTTEIEARAMSEILAERNLDPDEMSDSDFFALIPEAIKRAKDNP